MGVVFFPRFDTISKYKRLNGLEWSNFEGDLKFSKMKELNVWILKFEGFLMRLQSDTEQRQ